MKFSEELNSIANGKQAVSTETLKSLLSADGRREASRLWVKMKKLFIEHAECGQFEGLFKETIYADTKEEVSLIADYINGVMKDEGLEGENFILDVEKDSVYIEAEWSDKIEAHSKEDKI